MGLISLGMPWAWALGVLGFFRVSGLGVFGGLGVAGVGVSSFGA